jgi:hypothetical protein
MVTAVARIKVPPRGPTRYSLAGPSAGKAASARSLFYGATARPAGFSRTWRPRPDANAAEPRSLWRIGMACPEAVPRSLQRLGVGIRGVEPGNLPDAKGESLSIAGEQTLRARLAARPWRAARRASPEHRLDELALELTELSFAHRDPCDRICHNTE